MLKLSGAKDVVGFTRSIGRGFLPLASSIEYEGLYNEFYFNIRREREKIFSPKYSYCKSSDPFSFSSEHYLAIGLSSKFDGDGLQAHGRNHFNLVLSVDISGSMSAPLAGKADDKRSKMEITVNAIFSIMSLLQPDDRFGLITFNDDICVIQELKLKKDIDIPALKAKIVSLIPKGGTALSSALKKSTRMFDEVKKDKDEYKKRENTIVVLTDVVPSAKDVTTSTVVNIIQKNSLNSLFTTVVGIGSEFSSDLLKQLGKIRSCNYYNVHSAADFKQIIERDFVYTFCPVAFNISLVINSNQFVVERVYGSPGNELPSESGEMLKIESVSPSAVDESGKIKGGIILAKLKPIATISSSGMLNCRLQYEDRTGKIHVDEQKVEVPLVEGPNLYTGEADRKSVLLTRYVNISKHWILDQTQRSIAIENEDVATSNNNNEEVPNHTISLTTGITPPPLDEAAKKQRRIMFYVDLHYSGLFKAFISHFKEEISEIGDPLLEPYILTLEKMANFEQTKAKNAKEAASSSDIDAIELFVVETGDRIELTTPIATKILENIAASGKYTLLNKLWDQITKVVDQQTVLKAVTAAGANGHPKTLCRLLTLFKDMNKVINVDDIMTSLETTVQKGNLECVKEILSFVPDCNLTARGSKLLKTAYNYGKSRCARFLIEKGASYAGITLSDIEKDLSPKKNNANELDLVFCCDCTGSMGSYLKSAQESIINIASAIADQGECDVRFGLVKYRDHPPQDYTYVTEEHDFTRDTRRMKAYVDTMDAAGGGDGPECLVDGMEKCLNMDYRPTATKVVCIISDAPPHGLGCGGDGFPEGCPCGHDPIEVARAMSERGIAVYTLGVSLGNQVNLTSLLMAIAQITEGQYAPLSSADLLSNVIVGGSIEEIELGKLTSLVQEEWKAIVSPSLDLDDSLLLLCENLQKKNVKVQQMSIEIEKDEDRVNVFVGASNLEEAVKQLATFTTPKNTNDRKKKDDNNVKYKLEEKLISLKQVTRIWNRLNIKM